MTSAAPWGFLALAYLAGSFPTSHLVARAFGVDLRRYGSGNLGATNLYRAAGLAPAVLAAVVDITKGAAPTYFFPLWANAQGAWALAYGCAAALGHVFPVWTRFRGGKGVATGGGMFLVLAPVAVLAAAILWIAIVRATRIVSIGSLLAATSLPILAWATGRPPHVIAAAAAATLFVFVTHRSNLGRLLRGEELEARRGAGGSDSAPGAGKGAQ